jgi:hypothetical protein
MAGNLIQKILTGLELVAEVILAVIRTLSPWALPADTPAQAFSAKLALATIKAITRSPRQVGSPLFKSSLAGL